MVSRSIRLAAGATTVAAVIYQSHAIHNPLKLIHNDSDPIDSISPAKKQKILKAANAELSDAGQFAVWVWGTNRNGILFPADIAISTQKTPKPTPYIPSTPVRDLILHEKYGAAVDVKGDLWMWGKGYYGDLPADGAVEEGPSRSLKGKKLTSLAPTSSKLYAISTQSGEIYAIPADRAAQRDRSKSKSGSPWWTLGLGWLFFTDPGVDYVKLDAELKRGEKFTSVVAGKSHILALTNKGRTFSMAADPEGNSHHQLGNRVPLPPVTPTANATNIRWTTQLEPIPSLQSVNIAQVAAGSVSSYFRLAEGRVLGLGGNAYGQLGLGALASIDVVPVPSEVVLARAYAAGTAVKCLNISAGGNNAYYTVERQSPMDPGKTYVDLLAVGSGIAGGLGNGLWSSASSTAVKVKSVSGLQEYSEKLQSFIPLEIKNVSVSPSTSAQIFATLHTVMHSDAQGVLDGKYGNDVMAFGANQDYQLGNGKRSNLAVPQHLPPLRVMPATEGLREASMGSGTLSPMPHSRLQLHTGKGNAYDLSGKLLKRNVKAEQVMYAGFNASAVYWKAV